MRRSNYNVFGGLRKINQDKLRFINSDILDDFSQTAVDESDVIFHLAAEVPNQFSNQNAYRFDQINNWGSALLTRCIDKSNYAKKVIYLSSFQVYGNGIFDLQKDKPTKYFYGLSKLDGERHFERLLEENFHSVFILRFPTVYGHSKNLRLGTALIN